MRRLAGLPSTQEGPPEGRAGGSPLDRALASTSVSSHERAQAQRATRASSARVFGTLNEIIARSCGARGDAQRVRRPRSCRRCLAAAGAPPTRNGARAASTARFAPPPRGSHARRPKLAPSRPELARTRGAAPRRGPRRACTHAGHREASAPRGSPRQPPPPRARDVRVMHPYDRAWPNRRAARAAHAAQAAAGARLLSMCFFRPLCFPRRAHLHRRRRSPHGRRGGGGRRRGGRPRAAARAHGRHRGRGGAGGGAGVRRCGRRRGVPRVSSAAPTTARRPVASPPPFPAQDSHSLDSEQPPCAAHAPRGAAASRGSGRARLRAWDVGK